MWKTMITRVGETLSGIPDLIAQIPFKIMTLFNGLITGITSLVQNPVKLLKVLILTVFAYDLTLGGRVMISDILDKTSIFAEKIGITMGRVGWELLLLALIIVIVFKVPRNTSG